MNRILFIAIIITSTNFLYAQVSSSDINKFGINLEIRRELNVGMNPASPDYISVPVEDLTYNGVEAVSTMLIIKAYPEVNISLVTGFFSTIGLDKRVFDKFIYQIFLYTQANKKTTVLLINALCGNIELSNRIYEKYGKEYAKKIDSIITKKKQDEIKENSVNPKLTFNIPVKSDETDSLALKDKNISEIKFLAKGVQFNGNGQSGFDKNTEFEITINGNEVNFKRKYLDGYMLEKYIVDSIALSKENKTLLFFLLDTEKVERHSFKNPAKVEYELLLYYDNSLGYFIELNSLEGQDYKIFAKWNKKVGEHKQLA
jgi:hypothetical protein